MFLIVIFIICRQLLEAEPVAQTPWFRPRPSFLNPPLPPGHMESAPVRAIFNRQVERPPSLDQHPCCKTVADGQARRSLKEDV